MSPAEIERLNAKYGQFFVTRWSLKSGRNIQVGKPCRTLQEATAKAMRSDRNGQMAFVDVVRPKA